MKRILLTLIALMFILGIGLVAVAQQSSAPAASINRQVAVTFDDLPLAADGGYTMKQRQRVTADLIAKIKAANIPAVGFVNESKLYRLGEVDARIALLKAWTDAGLELGNHTFSHPSLNNTPLPEFEADVIRGETVTKMLLAEKGMKLRYFRHPFLRVGATIETRTAFEKFLAERGYTIAPVTLDNDDYVFALPYSKAAERGDTQQMKEIADAYLAHTEKLTDFYEQLSVELVGYEIKHVLLLHANRLNADYFDRLVVLFKKRGYSFITLEEALRDKAYSQPDTYAGQFGTSWLQHWMATKGMKIRWQPDPPAFVQKLYDAK